MFLRRENCFDRSMTRGLRHSLSALTVAVLLAAHVGAAGPTGASPLLQRFLAVDDRTPTQFRALRHLEARNEKFDKRAWMDVWTEVDASGFHYEIVGEDGSDTIRSKVFRAALDLERNMWAAGEPGKLQLLLERGASVRSATNASGSPRAGPGRSRSRRPDPRGAS